MMTKFFQQIGYSHSHLSKLTNSSPVFATATANTLPVHGHAESHSSLNVSHGVTQNFLLVWLDATVNECNPLDYQHSINELSKVVNTINKFISTDDCREFLLTIENEKVLMIVSGSLGQSFVPEVHGLRQLVSIYVFCGDESRHEKWAMKWPKVKGVFTEIDPICQALRQTTNQYERDSIPISIFWTKSCPTSNDFDQLDQSFMYTQILKEILLEMHFGKKSFKEFLGHCREQFVNNQKEMSNIDKFENEYRKQTPIWWYTYECFLYPMLNRALRLMEVDIIIKMGFFVQDLHRQITKLHHEQYARSNQMSTFIVYRGQGLSKFEFEKLNKTVGGLISFNSFLSTSKKPNIATIYAGRSLNDPDMVGIVFELTIDPSISSTPFALIDCFSFYKGSEQEILFSMHTVFRIMKIEQIDDNSQRMWKVHLKLTSDNDPQLNVLAQHIREKTGGLKQWFGLAHFLIILGQFKKSEDLYKVLLGESSKEQEKSYIYHQLGWIRDNLGDYTEAIRFYEKSLEIDKKTLQVDHLNLATSYDNLGLVYDRLGDYEKSLSSHEKALHIYRMTCPENHPDLATCYNNIGLAYYKLEKFTEALSSHQAALDIFKKIFPPNHPSLATSYNNIGLVHDKMCEHSTALWFFEKALDIHRKTLPPNHPDLAKSYQNIGKALEKLCEYRRALSSHQKGLDIFLKTFPADHPDLASCYFAMALIYSHMKKYTEALSFYNSARDIRQKTLPLNHPDLIATYNAIADVNDRLSNPTEALLFYKKVLEIHQKILASNSPSLASSFYNVARIYVSLRDFEKALSPAERAVEIGQRALRTTHPDLQIYKRTLESIRENL